ncbi:hypothetical protein [Synechococcus sp. CS-1328]|uniref:hypothetical protein n=1 Tax=Synechococcus sp. CS-1328 TaxID=2847976 RepID=UPI0037DA6275
MACHGSQGSHHGFVKAKHPEDRSFGLRLNDRRGRQDRRGGADLCSMVAVILPEASAVIDSSLESDQGEGNTEPHRSITPE